MAIPRIDWPETEAVLAVGAFLLFAATMWALFSTVIPVENKDAVAIALGAEIGLVKDTFARYFASTRGAAEQRKELMDFARTAQTPKEGGGG